MSLYEYKVIPAPRKGKSGKGIRSVPAKFANAVSETINNMSMEGWHYVRAETLPCEERQGLTGKTVNDHSLLVFRRPLAVEQAEPLDIAEPALSAHHDLDPDTLEPQDDESDTQPRRQLFATR